MRRSGWGMHWLGEHGRSRHREALAAPLFVRVISAGDSGASEWTQERGETDHGKFFNSADRPGGRFYRFNTIANDLSNMNTTAFKAETTNFSDLVLPADRLDWSRKSDPGGRGRESRFQ